MKLIKTASGNRIKISKKEWESIGKKAGWMKKAQVEVFDLSSPMNTKYIYAVATTPDSHSNPEEVEKYDGYISVFYRKDSDNYENFIGEDLEHALLKIGLEPEDENNYSIPKGQWAIMKPKLDALPDVEYSPELQREMVDTVGSVYEFDYDKI